MNTNQPKDLETDPRFPSGPWTGFFTQPQIPGRHMMELHLTFGHGNMSGEGRDRVGKFVIRGSYTVEDGKCHWTKRYLGRHDVFYNGYNEGKGIWGVWEIPVANMNLVVKGGFHIWPKGMADPTVQTLKEEADLPLIVTEEQGEEELVPLGPQI